jgi:hypothetical protein
VHETFRFRLPDFWTAQKGALCTAVAWSRPSFLCHTRRCNAGFVGRAALLNNRFLLAIIFVVDTEAIYFRFVQQSPLSFCSTSQTKPLRLTPMFVASMSAARITTCKMPSQEQERHYSSPKTCCWVHASSLRLVTTAVRRAPRWSESCIIVSRLLPRRSPARNLTFQALTHWGVQCSARLSVACGNKQYFIGLLKLRLLGCTTLSIWRMPPPSDGSCG